MQRSPGRWWHRPVIAPPSQQSPDVQAASPRFPQRRDARGRFVREEDGPRTVRNAKTGCELWTGPVRGGVPYDGRRSVLAIRYEDYNGEPVPPNHRLIRACRVSRCVNLGHARILGPTEALLYTCAVREPRWLRPPEVDEAVAVVSDLAQRLGISFEGLVAYLRWPHSLADDFADAPEPPGA